MLITVVRKCNWYNCNWQHSAFFILDTRLTGWELINHTADHQHVLMMPVTKIPAEVAGTFESVMGILDEEEMGITIVQDVELPVTHHPPEDHTTQENTDTLPSLATSGFSPSLDPGQAVLPFVWLAYGGKH